MFAQSVRLWVLAAAAVVSLSGALRAQELAAVTPRNPTLPLHEPLQKLEVYPTQGSLTSARRQLQLIATGWRADGQPYDMTSVAECTTSNAQVATVEHGLVRPLGNGTAEIVLQAGGQVARAQITVSGFDKVEPVSFQYEALVALTKNGCNSGACHGSPSGKGGFRLSLRAYDPEFDTETLVREAFNRRTNLLQPEASLLLRKPLMEVAHGGGRRMKPTDPAYHLLHDWIAEGLQAEPAEAAHCVGIEVYPKRRVFRFPSMQQQMSVLAHFSDGTTRDVTPIVSFSSSDEAVALVDESGLVTAIDRGESAILVRYLEHMQTAELMFLKDIDGFVWNHPAEANYIDNLVFSKLQTLQILPSELCTDEEFVRRVYLDVLGILPSPYETQQFLQNGAPDKRAQLIDQLLDRPEFAEFWALRWGDLLRANQKNLTPAGVHKLQRWLVSVWRDNMPYDQFVRELLTSSGSTMENPAASYFRAAGDTNDCTETTSQIFLGIRIQCAKCHNHPFERWTQNNYYGIGAFFNRVQRKKSATGDDMVVFVSREGEISQPRTGKEMKPWLPMTGEAEVESPEADRRELLADWMARSDNPFFAQAEVNRIWGYVMGRGIVDPVDDFRDSNPPSNRDLLAALAKDFIEHKFDRKYILRTILNSRTYQLSSRSNPFNHADVLYNSHAKTRLLSAEQLLDAIVSVTGVAEKYNGLPLGTRATQLPSPDSNNYFLRVFGQPAREMACTCERSNDSNLSQALQMINGPLVHAKLKSSNNRLREGVKLGRSNEELITDLYLSALSRPPVPEEMQAAVGHIASRADRMSALEDVCWALLNCKEFLFQH